MQNLSTLAARLFSVSLLLAFSTGVSTGQTRGKATSNASAAMAQLPITFEQNAGQTAPQVRFLSRDSRYRVYLTDNAAVLKVAGKTTDAVLRTTVVGPSSGVEVAGLEPRDSHTNYLVGPRASWKSNIPNYGEVEYAGIYPGIDLVYYGKQHQLEYDFDVTPHAKAAAIALKIQGANKITVGKDGSLILDTAAGPVTWAKPIAYQRTSAGKKFVTASYRLRGDAVTFEVGKYDRSKTLVIDPVLEYGTYLDGKEFDTGVSLWVDSAGYAYILGGTDSPDFPTTPGAYQKAIAATPNDQVFVTKLSQDGSSLIWSTIVGGTGPNNYSLPTGFAFDSTENVYIVGYTVDQTFNGNTNSFTDYPSTFPTTTGAYNTNHAAAGRNFLVKLNNTGSALIYSTFLSDQPNITAYAVAVDPADNAYVTGVYNHNGGLTGAFPATSGAYQASYGGHDDSLVMKFDAQATALDYATLIGGSQTEDASQIQVDADGNATINGFTYSPNYPVTPNGTANTDEGGFITTFNSAGSALLYSTVLHHVNLINVKRDTAGYYYVGGSAGTNLPVTAGAFQKTFPSPNFSGVHVGFFTEIDPSGNLVYSSYLGGNTIQGNTESTQIQWLGAPSFVTVTGDRSNDATFPVTDRNYEQDNCSFLATFNTQGSGKSSLSYSGCTPVNRTDNGTTDLYSGITSFTGSQMYMNSSSNLYAMGTNGPTTPGAFQTAPPSDSQNDGSFLWIGSYNVTQPGPGGVNLSAPYYWGPPYQSPVVYRATGRSPQCGSGVAAMRVYTAPGVIAYTTNGATLDANIAFPKDGQYNTVIVVYDNCGKAFTMGVPMYIQGTATPQNPNVVSPTNGAAIPSPVHFVATGSAGSCSKGVAALRIYTAPGVSAYTVNGANLDTYINLAPGNYTTVVQEWDNCGNVYKTPVAITVE
ncbi:MAG: hypothetical protein ACRD2S_11890 [Terriglobales bacterium]